MQERSNAVRKNDAQSPKKLEENVQEEGKTEKLHATMQ